MLQTGHWDRDSLGPTVECVSREFARAPRMPVINAEVCYEGIMEASREEVQRMMFWASMLSGTVGYTYGANGLWQLNRRDQPYGPSPHGFSWGQATWDEAYRLPGSTQVALGKRLLERYPWWQFEPHQEWCSPRASAENYFLPYAAGIPGTVRVIYFPWGTGFMWHSQAFRIMQLEPHVRYRAYFYNPVTGDEHPCGPVTADHDGTWQISAPPAFQDWTLVLDSIAPIAVDRRWV